MNLGCATRAPELVMSNSFTHRQGRSSCTNTSSTRRRGTSADSIHEKGAVHIDKLGEVRSSRRRCGVHWRAAGDRTAGSIVLGVWFAARSISARMFGGLGLTASTSLRVAAGEHPWVGLVCRTSTSMRA